MYSYYPDDLYHYGIRGQKWGVRRYQNKDGSLTDAGRKRLAKDIAKTYNKYDKRGVYVSDREKAIIDETGVFPSLQKSVKLREARKKWESLEQTTKDFFDNDELVEKYKLKAAHKAEDKYGYTRGELENSYLYDDADQGSDNSFSLYLKDKGIDRKKYRDDIRQARRDYRDVCGEVANDLLQKYGRTRVKYLKGTGETLTSSKVVEDVLLNLAEDEMIRNNYVGFWQIM